MQFWKASAARFDIPILGTVARRSNHYAIMASILRVQSAVFKLHTKPDRCSSFLMLETGPAQLFSVGNQTGAAAFCIGIRAGALDTAYYLSVYISTA